MFYQLTGQVKNRVIEELRDFWALSPTYRKVLPDKIQGKYRFNERPVLGMTVKCGSAQQQTLSADNYEGMDYSYVYCARVKGYGGTFLEWVREDALAIQRNNGVFPTPAGLYFIRISGKDDPATRLKTFQFWLTPYIDHNKESVPLVSPGVHRLTGGGFAAGSLRLTEYPSRYPLDASNFTADPLTGIVTLDRPLSANQWLEADYRVQQAERGPYRLTPETANNTALPGVILAFGYEIEDGDVQVVQVSAKRDNASMVYGGRFSISVEIDVIAQDVVDCQRVADRTLMHLVFNAKPRWAEEGVHVQDVSLGGDAEEQMDETGDGYFFTQSLSSTLELEWHAYVPLQFKIRNIVDMTGENIKGMAKLTDLEVAQQMRSSVQVVDDLTPVMSPFGLTQFGFPLDSVNG